jgi:outer membrane immunogenic protein
VAIAAPAAFGADLPVPPGAPSYYAPPPPAHYDWSGVYFGGQLGGGLINDTSTTTTATAFQPLGATAGVRAFGIVGGPEAGINFEFAPIVLGVEATWTATNISASQYAGAPFGVQEEFTSAPHWYATATGRFGVALNDLLFYAKGGGAWTSVDYTVAALVGGITALQTLTVTRSGWTAGAGIEYAFNDYLSAKLEYDLLDFGTQNYSFNNLAVAGGPFPVAIRSNIQLLTVGANYRFNWVKY